MKAAMLKRIGKIEVEEVKTPKCIPQSILIKVETGALCGSDIRAFRTGRKQLSLPQIMGHEVVGTVVQVGRDAPDVQEGDRLAVVPSIPCGQCRICKRGLSPDLCPNHLSIGFAYPGGFAEYMLIPPMAVRSHSYVPVPDTLDFETAVLAEPLGCVIHGQDLVRTSVGDRVVVIGAGPIGCMHALVARHRGAGQVILMQRSKKRLKLAQDLGVADAYVSILDQDPVEWMQDNTGGELADVVIVAASSKAAQQMAMELVGTAGRVSFFGGLRVSDPSIQISSNRVHYEELVITGAAGTGRQEVEKALDLLTANREEMRKLVTKKFALDEIHKAIRAAEDGEELKIALKP